MTPVLSWVNLILIIILIVAIAIIYFVYFYRSDNLERDGLAFNVIENTTSATSSNFAAGNYTLFINKASAPIRVTVNKNDRVRKGQQFGIANVGGGTVTVVAGDGVTISTSNIAGGTGVAQGVYAIYVATADSNTFQRIQ